jgi:transcriptional regulator with XRE-family HTH domain
VVIFKLLIEEYRKFMNLTEEELADKAGISQGFLNDIERGRSTPTLFTLDKISKALKISIGALIKSEFEDNIVISINLDKLENLANKLNISPIELIVYLSNNDDCANTYLDSNTNIATNKNLRKHS